jgi:hypothetical protein
VLVCWLQIHPFGRLPALQDGDLNLVCAKHTGCMILRKHMVLHDDSSMCGAVHTAVGIQYHECPAGALVACSQHGCTAHYFKYDMFRRFQTAILHGRASAETIRLIAAACVLAVPLQFETGAILLYLAEKFDTGRFADAKARARASSWILFTNSTLPESVYSETNK